MPANIRTGVSLTSIHGGSSMQKRNGDTVDARLCKSESRCSSVHKDACQDIISGSTTTTNNLKGDTCAEVEWSSYIFTSGFNPCCAPPRKSRWMGRRAGWTWGQTQSRG